MILPCRTSTIANRDVKPISDTIADANLSAAIRFLSFLRKSYELIGRYPGAGTKVRRIPTALRGLRSIPVRRYRNYLIFFIPHPDHIEVVRVVHGARKTSKILKEVILSS